MIAAADGAGGPPLERRVAVQTGGSPPSPTLLARMDRLGMDVTHLYGLTETFGPIGINEWQPQWDDLEADEQAALRARQGVGNVIAEPLRVVDGTGVDVPRDGRDGRRDRGPRQRRDARLLPRRRGHRRGRPRRLVPHRRPRRACTPTGTSRSRDRAKDMIITGGENVASVEVERVIDAHPDVVESAVVGRARRALGRDPGGLRDRARRRGTVTADEVAAHVREHLAGFKVPRQVHFGELPEDLDRQDPEAGAARPSSSRRSAGRPA